MTLSIKVQGKWLSATENEINIKDLPVEEYRGFYNSSSFLGKYPNPLTVKELAHLIESHGEVASLLFCKITCIEKTQKLLENGYLGIYSSIGDFAEEFYEKYGYSSEIVNRNEIVIDWERTAELWEDNECFLFVPNSFGQHHIFFLKSPFGF